MGTGRVLKEPPARDESSRAWASGDWFLAATLVCHGDGDDGCALALVDEGSAGPRSRLSSSSHRPGTGARVRCSGGLSLPSLHMVPPTGRPKSAAVGGGAVALGPAVTQDIRQKEIQSSRGVACSYGPCNGRTATTRWLWSPTSTLFLSRSLSRSGRSAATLHSPLLSEDTPLTTVARGRLWKERWGQSHTHCARNTLATKPKRGDAHGTLCAHIHARDQAEAW